MRTACALLFGMVLSVASCGGPDINTDRTPPEGGVDFDGGFEDDSGPPPGPCPASIPKVGESCGPGTDESTSCEFPQGQCRANGMDYNETAIYCCPNGVWEACGGASPCDMYMDAAELPPPEDAGVIRADAAGDGPDGGIDTAGDSAPDLTANE
jgi:hypothetical protein